MERNASFLRGKQGGEIRGEGGGNAGSEVADSHLS